MAALTLLLTGALPADAQSIGVRGFAMVGKSFFTAKDSFKTIFDKNDGPIYGGGAELLVPWKVEPLDPRRSTPQFIGHLFVSVSAWQFKADGQRVFIGPNDEIFRLAIPLTVRVTPIEVTGGYRLSRSSWRIVPYVGVGYSSYRYQETSSFADASENVDERFGGWHVLAGAEFRLMRWVAVAGETSWSSVPDAFGQSGVSQHFHEDNLGGATMRLKISVGR